MVCLPFQNIWKSQLKTDFTTEPLRHPYMPSIALNEIQGSTFFKFSRLQPFNSSQVSGK